MSFLEVIERLDTFECFTFYYSNQRSQDSISCTVGIISNVYDVPPHELDEVIIKLMQLKSRISVFRLALGPGVFQHIVPEGSTANVSIEGTEEERISLSLSFSPNRIT